MRSHSSRLRAALLAGLLALAIGTPFATVPAAEAQTCPTPYATAPQKVKDHTYYVDYYSDPSGNVANRWSYFQLWRVEGVTLTGVSWLTPAIVRITYTDVRAQKGEPTGSYATVRGDTVCTAGEVWWYHTTTFRRR